MALHFPLQVNGQTIGTFEARRRHVDFESDEDDDYVTYEIDMQIFGGDVYRPNPASRHTFSVEHRPSSGAFALVQAAIAESVFASREAF